MSDLDDKLREVLRYTVNGERNIHATEMKETLAQIKQAFANAGYVQTLKTGDRTIVANGKDPFGWIVYYPDEVMTGQEWYDRFMAELDKPLYNDTKKYQRQCPECGSPYLLETAAKRAAGLEDDKT